MNFGFNSNVTVGTKTYHVQTEDRGPARPFIDTVVYERGQVVHKLSTAYQDLLAKESSAEDAARAVRALLTRQHREVISELETGMLVLNANSPAAAKPPAGIVLDGLQVRLLNAKSWLRDGKASLHVELRSKEKTAGVSEADVEAFLETEHERSNPVRGRTDATGTSVLEFTMPTGVSDGTTLVIRATDGALYGELRFQLRAKRSEKIPAEPRK